MSRSAELWARARAVLPGGVNSPVRAFRAVGGSPFFVSRARGARLWTVDGHVLLDYVMSWGPLLLGHDPAEVRVAITEALQRGWTYGAPCEAEVLLAEEVARRMPSLEMVRFVNSGTEAAMAALRLARAATGREKILKFDGCYHGHADAFLVRAGSGVATLGLPDSPGVPPAVAALTLTTPFNDLERAVAMAEREELAAIIVEPFVGNAGFIPPRPAFLEGLRDVSTRTGALLVFDEVMTGFRVHAAGAQGLTGVIPDLTILGKVIGGGLPVGAFGGPRRLMELVAPQGPVYQAGTLSGNPLAMAAGLATLRAAAAPAFYDRLEARGRALIAGLAEAAGRAGVPFTGAARGGMFGFFFHPGPVDDFAAARRSDTALFARFHRAALAHGVFLAPSAFEAGFVSGAHTDADIDETIAQLGEALAAAGS